MSRAKHRMQGRPVMPGRVPVRADLANVAPLFYPIVEQQRADSMAAAAESVGLPAAVLAEYQATARVNCSEYVVIDRMCLGNPANKVCLALVPVNDGQAVAVCAAFMGELSPTADEAMSFAVELAQRLGPIGQGCDRLAFVGSFRINPQGAQQ